MKARQQEAGAYFEPENDKEVLLIELLVALLQTPDATAQLGGGNKPKNDN